MNKQSNELTGLPLVSVIIPSYNHEKYIVQALESVLSQDYPNIECIVVDDGSTDKTLYLARELESKNKQKLRVFSQKNSGVSSALNRAASEAGGVILAVLGSDDMMDSSRISKQVAALQSTPEIALVHTDALKINKAGKALGRFQVNKSPSTGDCFLDAIHRRLSIVAPSATFTKNAYDTVGGFDESSPVEDWPFYAAIAAHGFHIGYINEQLTYYRVSEGQLSTKTHKYWRSSLKVIDQYIHLLPEAQYNDARRSMLQKDLRTALAQDDYQNAIDIFREFYSLPSCRLLSLRTAFNAISRRIVRSLIAIPSRMIKRDNS